MSKAEPLASQIRPTTLDDYIGQSHLVGKDKPLRVAIESQHLFSMIFWGPPGTGKTTLAKIYAKALNAHFHELSAVSAGKDDVRKIIYVESCTLTLIGATTENPSFEVISPLLSRCRVFTLNELTDQEMLIIINRSLKKLTTTASQTAKDWLVRMANGDARQAITMLDNTYQLYRKITLKNLKNTLQNSYLRFDKQGEEHYNTISAFIKSMRASDVNATLYYLARMVNAGEDPKFIARRMVIFASEDIGLAAPTALVVANEVFRAVETIGYPECQINLAHGAAYLASCRKDKSAYHAYFKALDDVKNLGNLPIPLNLRNAPTKLMKNLGYGQGYQPYTKASLLPEKIKNKQYFTSSKPAKKTP